MTKYCKNKKIREWAIGRDVGCGGDYEHCKNIVSFGDQKYCGYCPGRVAMHQTIRDQAGCIWCVNYTKDLTCKKCAECLSAKTRINFVDCGDNLDRR